MYVWKTDTLLAILGRGMQRVGNTWRATPDIEVYDEKWRHFLDPVEENDDDSRSAIGGGELNLLAGVRLVDTFGPRKVVCAYGNPTTYLTEAGAPSECFAI